MSASFLSAMNTRANHFAIDEENKKLKKQVAELLKEKEELKKELEEVQNRIYEMCEIAQANDWDIYPSASESDEESDEEEEETPNPRKINASPSAQQFAKENGLDISKVIGSGPEGKVLLKDVKAKISGKTD